MDIFIIKYLTSRVSELDINIADEYGKTSLHHVVWCNKNVFKQQYMQAITDSNENKVIQLSALVNDDEALVNEGFLKMCKYGFLNLVKWVTYFLTIDENFLRIYFRIPLMKYAGKIHTINELYTAFDDVCSRCSTPLTAACSQTNTSVPVHLLKEFNFIGINSVDGLGNTPLHYSINLEEKTLLHEECERGSATGVMKLVSVNDHVINMQDSYGRTPLHFASYYGHTNIVEILRLLGVDESIFDDYGLTPAQLANRWQQLSQLLNADPPSQMQQLLQRYIAIGLTNQRQIVARNRLKYRVQMLQHREQQRYQLILAQYRKLQTP